MSEMMLNFRKKIKKNTILRRVEKSALLFWGKIQLNGDLSKNPK